MHTDAHECYPTAAVEHVVAASTCLSRVFNEIPILGSDEYSDFHHLDVTVREIAFARTILICTFLPVDVDNYDSPISFPTAEIPFYNGLHWAEFIAHYIQHQFIVSPPNRYWLCRRHGRWHQLRNTIRHDVVPQRRFRPRFISCYDVLVGTVLATLLGGIDSHTSISVKYRCSKQQNFFIQDVFRSRRGKWGFPVVGCFYCGDCVREEDTGRCSRCHTVSYHTEGSCQQNDWVRHRLDCTLIEAIQPLDTIKPNMGLSVYVSQDMYPWCEEMYTSMTHYFQSRHATKIQRGIRYYLKIKRLQIREKNAIKLETCVRGFLARKLYRQCKCATTIQSYSRRFLVRTRVLQESFCAVKIQGFLRTCKAHYLFLQQRRSALTMQSIIRHFLGKVHLQRQRENWNGVITFQPLILQLLEHEMELALKLGRVKTSHFFGKSWKELRQDKFLGAQSNELDTIIDAALESSADDTEDKLAEPLEQPKNKECSHSESDDKENDFSPRFQQNIQTKPASKSARAEIEIDISEPIDLTPFALRWLSKQNDMNQRDMFFKRLKQLAAGYRSWCLSKTLKGSKALLVTETKLDKCNRIIWTKDKRNNAITIWFVCKHKHITRCRELVEMSYDRVKASQKERKSLLGESKENLNILEQKEPEMLVEPLTNVPLKVRTINFDDLDKLAVEGSWQPPIKLTSDEERIVRKEGTVLLLGRSGTGKTLCVCNRMLRDAQVHGKRARRIFVGKTRRLCNYIKRVFERSAGNNVGEVDFKPAQTFTAELYSELRTRVCGEDSGEFDRFNGMRLIDFNFFCCNIWKEVKGKEKELDELQVWTQIRSFIKGSYDAASQFHPLSREQYMALPIKRCRLSPVQRSRVYEIFERYQWLLDEQEHWWDEMDRVVEITSMLHRVANHEIIRYDRLYVVQDLTQAEIGLLFLVATNPFQSLFLAGDPAQAVSKGVDFRFEEVRSLVHTLSGGQRKIEKWEKLAHNFRSHEGIMRVANFVLDRLHTVFPDAVVKLPVDHGLVFGPRPGLLQCNIDDIAGIINANQKIRILTRDDYRDELCKKLITAAPDARESVWGIIEAKGLEFSDVVIVDFFSSLSESSLQKYWKQILLDQLSSRGGGRKKSSMPSPVYLPQSMELELKLFYTAITRSCSHLLFVETSQTGAYDAFCRVMHNRKLAQSMQPDEVTADGSQKIMTTDDWRIEGLDMAVLADDVKEDGISEAQTYLHRAMSAFRKSKDSELECRAEAHLRALDLEEKARSTHHIRQSNSNGESTTTTLDNEFTRDAALTYLEAGLTMNAAFLCRNYCSERRLGENLATRFERLMS